MRLPFPKLHLPRIRLPFRSKSEKPAPPSANPIPSVVIRPPSPEAARIETGWMLRERPLGLQVTNGMTSASSLSSLDLERKPLPPLPHERTKPLPALPDGTAQEGHLLAPARPTLHHQASGDSIGSYNPQLAFFGSGSPEPGQTGQGRPPLRIMNPDASPASSTESLVSPPVPNFSRPFGAANPPPGSSRPAPQAQPPGYRAPPSSPVDLPARATPHQPGLDPASLRYSSRLHANAPGHPKPYRPGLDPESPLYRGEPPAHRPRGPLPPGSLPFDQEPRAL